MADALNFGTKRKIKPSKYADYEDRGDKRFCKLCQVEISAFGAAQAAHQRGFKHRAAVQARIRAEKARAATDGEIRPKNGERGPKHGEPGPKHGDRDESS